MRVIFSLSEIISFSICLLEIINLQDPIEEIVEEKLGYSPKFKKTRDTNNAALRKSCEFQAFFNKHKATEKRNSSEEKKTSLNGAPPIEKDISTKKNLFSGRNLYYNHYYAKPNDHKSSYLT